MTTPAAPSVEALIAYLVDNSLRTYSIAEVADLLNCKPRFIEDNLKKLPHIKAGRSISFDADQVRRIKAMHRVNPLDAVEEPDGLKGPQQPEEREAAPSARHLALAEIRPAAGRRRAN
ncbi:hypothetical protein AB0912_15320 [Streptomyces sp. NPDC007084]|uniref:hypothetical protein n=1 Tax=Streptomyces sp. NPDC007084 TaxID=3154313 RepID=UPI003452CE8A